MEPSQSKHPSSLAVDTVPAKVVSRVGATETPKSSSKKNFPQVLFDLLNCGANDEIIKWVAGGTAFIIADRKRFTNETLPRYFRGTQYKSFIRKINRWKFRRITHGPHTGAYQHEHFLRADRSRSRLMSCGSTSNPPPSLASKLIIPLMSQNNCEQPTKPKTIPNHDDAMGLLFLKNSRMPSTSTSPKSSSTCSQPSTTSYYSLKDVLDKYEVLERQINAIKRNSLLLDMQMKMTGRLAALRHNTALRNLPTQDLHSLVARLSSQRRDTSQPRVKGILKKSVRFSRDCGDATTVDTASTHLNSRRLQLLQQMEAHRKRMTIEKKMRLVMMKAEEVKLLNDIKYLTMGQQQAKASCA